MNAIALCHNRDLQKTNGRIIVLGSGSISLMQTATWVNMQPSSQSQWFCLRFDCVMVCLSVCLPVCRLWLSPRLWAHFLVSCRLHPFTRSLAFPSQAVTLRSTYLPGQPRVQGGWTDLGLFFCFFLLFPKQAAKPAVFFSVQYAFQRWGPCFVVCWL